MLQTKRNFKSEKKVLEKLLKNSSGKSTAIILLNFGWLHDQHALINKNKKNIKEHQGLAKMYFEKALQKGVKKHLGYNGLGTLQLHTGNYPNALSYFKKAHSLHKTSSSYNALGNAYRQLGKFKAAKRNYLTALKTKSIEEKSAALYNLIQLLREAQKGSLPSNSTARNYINTLQTLSKKSPSAKILYDRIMFIH